MAGLKKHVGIRVTVEVKEKAEIAAEQLGTSISAELRKAIKRLANKAKEK